MKPIRITASEFYLTTDETTRRRLRWQAADGWQSVYPERTEEIDIVVTSPDGLSVASIRQTPPATCHQTGPQPNTTPR